MYNNIGPPSPEALRIRRLVLLLQLPSVFVDFVPSVVVELEHRKSVASSGSGDGSGEIERGFLRPARACLPRQRTCGSQDYGTNLQFSDQVAQVGSTALARSGTRWVLREPEGVSDTLRSMPSLPEESHIRIDGEKHGIKSDGPPHFDEGR